MENSLTSHEKASMGNNDVKETSVINAYVLEGNLLESDETSYSLSRDLKHKRRRWDDSQHGGNETPMITDQNNKTLSTQDVLSKWDVTPKSSCSVSRIKSRWDESPMLQPSLLPTSFGTSESLEASDVRKRSRWDETPTQATQKFTDNSAKFIENL